MARPTPKGCCSGAARTVADGDLRPESAEGDAVHDGRGAELPALRPERKAERRVAHRRHDQHQCTRRRTSRMSNTS
jgi:hypothetical protein